MLENASVVAKVKAACGLGSNKEVSRSTCRGIVMAKCMAAADIILIWDAQTK